MVREATGSLDVVLAERSFCFISLVIALNMFLERVCVYTFIL